jgi:hypothetical protein
MRSKTRRVDGSSEGFAFQAAKRGRIVAIDERGQIFVSVAAKMKPTLAVLSANVDERSVRTALDAQADVILLFEDGDVSRPIIIGLFPSAAKEVPAATAQPWIEADVDGRRIRVVAKDEIVFLCGKASITMRRNGKLIVRGTHVETNSEGTNRIKGGQVKIN